MLECKSQRQWDNYVKKISFSAYKQQVGKEEKKLDFVVAVC